MEKFRNQLITEEILLTDEFQDAYHKAVKKKLQELQMSDTEDNYNYCEDVVCNEYNIKYETIYERAERLGENK